VRLLTKRVTSLAGQHQPRLYSPGRSEGVQMQAQRLTMRRVRELLRLHYGMGASPRAIARELGVSRSTVKDYLARATAAAWLGHWRTSSPTGCSRAARSPKPGRAGGLDPGGAAERGGGRARPAQDTASRAGAAGNRPGQEELQRTNYNSRWFYMALPSSSPLVGPLAFHCEELSPLVRGDREACVWVEGG
jgi:DNA-binding CsgD family transcriptional regulator